MEDLIITPYLDILSDCFIPQSAPLVLEVCGEWEDSTCAVLMELAAMDAEWWLLMRKN
jgi:hypothetical protein